MPIWMTRRWKNAGRERWRCAEACRPSSPATLARWTRLPLRRSRKNPGRWCAMRMNSTGATAAEERDVKLSLSMQDVNGVLLQLESQGQVLRGRFRPNSALSTHDSSLDSVEWCDRRLLARIHRLTIGKLRREIEPVTAAEFMRFLFQWQHVAAGSRLHGEAGLLEIIRQLAGFEAAASAWERYVLPGWISKYNPALFDRLCLSGSVTWGRLTPPVTWEWPPAQEAREPT